MALALWGQSSAVLLINNIINQILYVTNIFEMFAYNWNKLYIFGKCYKLRNCGFCDYTLNYLSSLIWIL